MGIKTPGKIKAFFPGHHRPGPTHGCATILKNHTMVYKGGEVLSREKIKKDLLEQLQEKGLTQSFYTSLVDDYLDLWDIKNMLIKNIREEGVVITYNNGGGQTGRKKNDAVPELNKVNGQMLKILCDLGLRGADIKVEKTDFEL